jgi:hypothetical protein
MVRNAMPFDALKKRPGYGAGCLHEHLHKMTQYAANPSEAFQIAQQNFRQKSCRVLLTVVSVLV